MKKKIVTLMLAGMMSISVIACGGTETSDSSNQETTEDATTDSKEETATESEEETSIESEEENKDIIEVIDLLICPTFTAEKKSSAMVDQIALTAREYADSLSEDQVSEIISIIRDADHKFYNGPEEMEKFMWYGYLLDYKYDDSDPRSELGTDLCQAIKYVYRDVESVLDDATHENLLQIDEDLAKIQ